MKYFLTSLLFLLTSLHLFAEDSQYLIGASFGQFRADSTLDTDGLSNSYGAKLGIKEGLGIVSVAYDYAGEVKNSDKNIKEKYSSALLLLDGLTKPTKFIGPLQAQVLLGVHGGMVFAESNGVSKEAFQYGLEGGAYFPMGSILAFEVIYRYSFTNLGFELHKVDNIQLLNFGLNLTF